MKQLYIITYENSHYCGGELHCLVWAEDEFEAEMLAADFMDETQRELFSREYCEDFDEDEIDCPTSVTDVELLAGSDFEKYVADPSQASFYPYVN